MFTLFKGGVRKEELPEAGEGAIIPQAACGALFEIFILTIEIAYVLARPLAWGQLLDGDKIAMQLGQGRLRVETKVA